MDERGRVLDLLTDRCFSRTCVYKDALHALLIEKRKFRGLVEGAIDKVIEP
jgi:hypothetical protein